MSTKVDLRRLGDKLDAALYEFTLYKKAFAMYTQNMQQSMVDINIRISVLEHILINDKLQDLRVKLIQTGALSLDDFRSVAETYVIPEIEQQIAEMQKQRVEAAGGDQQAVESSHEEPSLILKPDGSPANEDPEVIPVPARPRLVMRSRD